MRRSNGCNASSERGCVVAVTNDVAFRGGCGRRVTGPRGVDGQFASSLIDRLKRIGVHF